MSLWSFLKRLTEPPSRRFGAWQVELTTRCPLRCRMCIRQGLDGWQGQDMPIEEFRRMSPYFRYVDNLVLEGWGEPLLYPHLLDAIHLVKSNGARAGFVTSGKGLTRDYSAALVGAGLDFIGFSLAGATAETHNPIRVHSDYVQLLQAIEDMVAIKRDHKLSGPHLHIVYLMIRDNLQEIPLLLETAKQIGILDVVLINLIHVTTDWQDQQKVFTCEANKDEPIMEAVETLAGGLGIRLRRAALAPQEVAICAENPLDNVYISVNGEVSPCVYLYPPTASSFHRIFCGSRHAQDKVSFGNLFETPLEEIWNTTEYAGFRQSFKQREKTLSRQYGSIPVPPLNHRERHSSPSHKGLPDPPEPCRTCHKMLGL
jgi:MoaA/NifB/PqqE/SkfB family radical SAM enzyme